MNNDWSGYDCTITGAMESLRETIKGCGIDLEKCGIHDDEALTLFAINFLKANATDAFEGLQEEDEDEDWLDEEESQGDDVNWVKWFEENRPKT